MRKVRCQRWGISHHTDLASRDLCWDWAMQQHSAGHRMGAKEKRLRRAFVSLVQERVFVRSQHCAHLFIVAAVSSSVGNGRVVCGWQEEG